MDFPMKWLLNTLLLGMLASIVQAAPFVVPNDVNPPFHRERLPIDTDSMASLSGQLTLLAQGSSLESPPLSRATAQSLALALSLDPANSSARNSLTQIAKGETQGRPDSEKLSRAKAGIWEMFDWLAGAEAGRDGNLLADLLGDAASILDPAHPTAVSLRGSGERGKWDGWVAPLTSFSNRPPKILKPRDEIEPKNPIKESDPALPPKIKLTKASIETVLYDYDEGAQKFILRPTTVRMDARASEHSEQGENGRGLRLDVTCREGYEDTTRTNVAQPILAALEKLHGNRLPDGKVSIRTGKAGNYSNTRNQDDMTGPGLILANSSITGIEPGATIIATLDGADRLALPGYFWSKLEVLADGPGGRLIVPAAAAEYLTAILALEKPDFFLKYEVLLASSPEEAIALCAKVQDESHAAVFAKFKEIKDKAESSALGAYLANRFVRQRLTEISQAAPYHFSAKILAIQGAGERPHALDKKILAAEIFQAIDPIQAYANINIYEIDGSIASGMDAKQEAAKALLDQLDRYAEIRDRDLIARGKSLCADLRSLARIIRGRGEMSEKYDQISSAYKTMAATNRELRKELSMITGDPLPEDAEAVEKERLRRRERMQDR